MPANIVEYLDIACEKFPNRPALSDKNSQTDYKTLKKRVDCVAGFVREKLGKANKPVFVGISRNIESIILFLGVAKSGNFFVPVDFSLPQNRILQMKATCAPSFCLLANEKARPPFDDIPIYNYSQISEYEGLYTSEKTDFYADAKPSDPLYCIFTSGSTGTPKGVIKTNGSVINMTECFSAEFGFDESRIFGNQCPFDFDVSYKDIFSAIYNGASLHILEKMLFSFPVGLIERINERKINTLLWSVSAMKMVCSLNTFSQITPSDLKQVMFSGEIIPQNVLKDWIYHSPNTEFINLYGPTEIAYNCTFYRVKKEYNGTEPVPIGKAFSNTEVFLWDGKREVTECAKTAEIYIKSSGLAVGYYGDETKTRESFIPDPRTKDGRVYKTGDNGAYNENGDLIFKGRSDWQIKHMGHRIELAEIEAAASALGYISSVCCIFDKEHDKICLCFEGEKEQKAQIFKDLRSVLPSYMVPTEFYALEKMPRTRTGKTDRMALRAEYIDFNNTI